MVGTLLGAVSQDNSSSGGLVAQFRLAVKFFSVDAGETVPEIKEVDIRDQTSMAKEYLNFLDESYYVIVMGKVSYSDFLMRRCPMPVVVHFATFCRD